MWNIIAIVVCVGIIISSGVLSFKLSTMTFTVRYNPQKINTVILFTLSLLGFGAFIFATVSGTDDISFYSY